MKPIKVHFISQYQKNIAYLIIATQEENNFLSERIASIRGVNSFIARAIS